MGTTEYKSGGGPNFSIVIGLCLGLLIGLVLMCEKIPDDGRRPIRVGDVVIHKLGRKGVIVGEIPHYYSYGQWCVRIEGGDVEGWATEEIEYIVTESEK